MIKKPVKEWFVKAPWGKIAMVSWGVSSNPPVLLVHGYMDTAATFIPLVDQLPDTYCYVGFDMPGHGKSDPFPQGLMATQIHIVEIIRRVVKHMNWRKFVCLSHSMGCVIVLFYHHVYPNHIKKMIFLDPLPPLSMYYIAQAKPDLWFQAIYMDYYDNYKKLNSGKPRLHTYDSAVSLLVRNRSLTEEQAEIVLSRSLIPMGIDSYKLSWEPRMKRIAQIPMPEETIYTIMTTKIPPTLSIDASESKDNTDSKKFAENLLNKCEQTLPFYYRVTVEGGHDVHITNPELLSPHIEKFLNGDENRFESIFKKLCKL